MYIFFFTFLSFFLLCCTLLVAVRAHLQVFRYCQYCVKYSCWTHWHAVLSCVLAVFCFVSRSTAFWIWLANAHSQYEEDVPGHYWIWTYPIGKSHRSPVTGVCLSPVKALCHLFLSVSFSWLCGDTNIKSCHSLKWKDSISLQKKKKEKKINLLLLLNLYLVHIVV